MCDHRWVICAALFGALACGAVRADEWSGKEITDKFAEQQREIDKFEGLVSASSSARLRIAELEGEMRLLRRQVAELESALRTAREAIKDMELDIAKVAVKRDASRTVHTPANPAAEPTVAPATGQAVVSGSRVKNEGDFTVITGIVGNTTDDPLTFVVVRADFLDARGNVVKSESVYTSPRVIGPRGKAAFKINTRRDHRVRTHRLTVETR